MRRRRSLTFKIILGIVLTILPVNLFMIFLAKTSQDVTADTARASMANTARVTLNRLEASMENINSFIWLMENSDANLKAITELTDHDAYYIAGIGLRQAMDQHMLSYGDADAWFFYSENVGEGMVVEDSEELSARQFQDAVLSDKALLADTRWRIQEIDGTQWLMHTNQWRGVVLGAGIQLDKPAAEARDSLGYETAEAYFSDSSDGEPARDRYAASEQCRKRDLWLHVSVDSREVGRSLPLLRRISYALALAGLILMPLIIVIIQHLVLKPLGNINVARGSLRADPQTRLPECASSSDFENVNRSFNQMADKIVELRIDNYEREIQRQKVELRNLQLQIKPHFLFNSLNLIYNLVQMGEYQSVQQMLLYFSDYFRYINVGDKDFSLLAEELELIRKYVGVAKIRYPGIVDAEFDVSDEALEAELPQLLAHNFVENIVKQGLDLSRENHIQLRAWLEDGDLLIEIEDDGIGMPPEQAGNINHGYDFEARKDVCDELGFTFETGKLYTLDDLEALFTAYKEKYGDGYYCVAGTTSSSEFFNYIYSHVDNMDNGTGGFTDGGLIDSVNKDNTTIVDIYASDAYMEYAKKMYEWAQKGFFSSDAATNTDSGTAQVASGYYLGQFNNIDEPAMAQHASAFGTEMLGIRLVSLRHHRHVSGRAVGHRQHLQASREGHATAEPAVLRRRPGHPADVRHPG